MTEKKVDPDKLLSKVESTKVRQKTVPEGVELADRLFGDLFRDIITATTTTWTTTTATTTTTTYDAGTGIPRGRRVNMRKEYNFPLNIQPLEHEGAEMQEKAEMQEESTEQEGPEDGSSDENES